MVVEERVWIFILLVIPGSISQHPSPTFRRRESQVSPNVSDVKEFSRTLFLEDESFICHNISNKEITSKNKEHYLCNWPIYEVISKCYEGEGKQAHCKTFLQHFLQSSVGKLFIGRFKQAGFSPENVKAQLERDWFTPSPIKDYLYQTNAFQRVFFRVLRRGLIYHGPYDWYGFMMASKTGMIYNVSVTSRTVQENHIHGLGLKYFCQLRKEVWPENGTTSIMLGLHPYYNFALLTLCLWSSEIICDSILPGKPKRNVKIVINIMRNRVGVAQFESGYIKYPE